MKRNADGKEYDVTPVKKSRHTKEKANIRLIDDEEDGGDDTISRREFVVQQQEDDSERTVSEDDQYEGEEDDNVLNRLAISVFRSQFFANGQPFIHTDEDRTYALDSNTTRHDRLRIDVNAERDAELVLFSRNLTLLVNGEIISKHCAPWGENSVLCGASFRITRKIFRSDNTVSSIIVSPIDATQLSFSLDPAFFDGWADDDTYLLHNKFKEAKVPSTQ